MLFRSQGIAHAVFASRRGLLPAVRVFIDYLAERLPSLLEDSSLDCKQCAAAHPGLAAAGKPAAAPARATMR